MKKFYLIALCWWVSLIWLYTVSHAQTACTMEYAPVCWKISVQCIKAPCPAISQTFSNKCEATARWATDIKNGECDMWWGVGICTKESKPVCGKKIHECCEDTGNKPEYCTYSKVACDQWSKTYQNECIAKNDGATSIRPWTCGNKKSKDSMKKRMIRRFIGSFK